MIRIGTSTTLLVLVATAALAGRASADEAGCTVVMCLSNPAGWASVAQCVAPVQTMFANLRNGGSLSCNMGGGPTPGVTYSQGKKPSQRWIAWTDSAGVRQLLNY